MGPMLMLVVGIISCVGFSIYHLGEAQRFEVIGDSKNGGIFILDKKNASVNYCTDQVCKLIGNGSLPSQAHGNPAILAAMQNSIMGSPAVITAKNNGFTTPDGMKSNIAASGAAPPATQAQAVEVGNTAAVSDEDDAEKTEASSEFDFN